MSKAILIFDSEDESKAETKINDQTPQESVKNQSLLAQISHSTSNVLTGASFLVTGQLTEMSRDDAHTFIRRQGGKVMSAMSGKLTYLVVGSEPGEAKLAKAKDLRVRQLSEIDLYKMVQTKLALTPPKKEEPIIISSTLSQSACEDTLWSDKYAPQKPSDLCYPCMYNRIKQFLLSFESGNEKKGMLVSGPPGIGKTTSVYVAARELRYDIIELNTSNQRSGSVLHDLLNHTVCNHGLFTKKNLLLLDEVDGCEKGGINEIIKFLKKTTIPIICTCNDHWEQKLKPLLSHVEDYRAQRTPYHHMSSYFEKVLEKEGVRIPMVYLQEMVMANGHDYRSFLNNMQLWSKNLKSNENVDVSLQSLGKTAKKDLDINIFDTAKAFFDANTRESFGQRYIRLRNLYYSNDLIPLFIQENYLNYTANTKTSQLLSTADVLQNQILINQQWQLSSAHYLHSALYPHKLCRGKYQSFISYISAHDSRVRFPAVLGKSSTIRKNYGIGQEILAQGTLQTFDLGTFSSTIAAVILQCLIQYLQDQEKNKPAYNHVVNYLQQYRLIRSDIDFINEITLVNSKMKFKFSFEALSHGMKRKLTVDCTAANLIERQRKKKSNTDTNGEDAEKIARTRTTVSKRKSTVVSDKKPKSSRKKT